MAQESTLSDDERAIVEHVDAHDVEALALLELVVNLRRCGTFYGVRSADCPRRTWRDRMGPAVARQTSIQRHQGAAVVGRAALSPSPRACLIGARRS